MSIVLYVQSNAPKPDQVRHLSINGSQCSILRITEYDSILVEHLIYLFWLIAGIIMRMYGVLD